MMKSGSDSGSSRGAGCTIERIARLLPSTPRRPKRWK